MKHITLNRLPLFAVAALIVSGCLGSDDKEGGHGAIEFRIKGEDIPYHKLLGEDDLGYVHADSATIDYAYMLVRSPKLNPAGHAKISAAAGTAHTGVNLPGFFAVDLLQGATLGTVADVEAGSYADHPEITIYPANDTERTSASMSDPNGALAKIPSGYSFRFGGILYTKADGAVRYEIRESVTGVIMIEEFPPEAGEGTPLVVNPGQTLVASFHPHIDHALEVILNDNELDWSSLTMSGDTVVFSPTTNSMVDGVDIYADIEGHIKQGDHWDVNVIPD